MRQIGQRVGAILKADAETVHLLGYGVYDGEHEPPFGPMGIPKVEYEALLKEMQAKGELPEGFARWTNPRITLDSGEQVWGCQCWWASEERVREMIGNRRVVAASLRANSREPPSTSSEGGAPEAGVGRERRGG